MDQSPNCLRRALGRWRKCSETAEWNSGYSQTDVETAAPFGLVVGTIKFFDHGLPVPVAAAALLTPSLRLLVGALREVQSIHLSNDINSLGLRGLTSI